MVDNPDIFAVLDRPEILSFVFYPREDFSPSPSGARDVSFPMPDGISIGGRFYHSSKQASTLIYFHGNGELASDYEFIAPQFASINLNLLVIDYRGYGTSGGTPTIRNLVGDAVPAYLGALGFLTKEGYTGPVFVMGRSLGSVPAIELAAARPEAFNGLIIESGFGSMSRLLLYLDIGGSVVAKIDADFPNLQRIRDVRLPTLVLHGERDSLIPRSEGESLYRESPASDKSMVIIRGADHNDIMVRDMATYFGALKDFLARNTAG